MYPNVLMSALIICNSIFAHTVNGHVCVTAVLCDYVYSVLLPARFSVNGWRGWQTDPGCREGLGCNNRVTQVTMRVNGKPHADLGFTYNSEVRCFMQTYTLTFNLPFMLSKPLIQLLKVGTFNVDKRVLT